MSPRVLLILPLSASADILGVSSSDFLLGDRSQNLILNGSFEEGYDGAAFWGTGTTLTYLPFAALADWTASGSENNYATWTSSADTAFRQLAPVPDGEAGVYFGTAYGFLDAAPTFETTGEVTFSNTPNFSTGYGSPVTLSQTVTGLDLSQTYRLEFWISGERAANNGNVGSLTFEEGIFAFDMSGEDTRYLAAPVGSNINASGTSDFGKSQRYHIEFTPTVTDVTFSWTNYGHFGLNIGGQNAANNPWLTTDPGATTEFYMDDVVLNQIPEPSSVCLALLALPLLARRRMSA